MYDNERKKQKQQKRRYSSRHWCQHLKQFRFLWFASLDLPEDIISFRILIPKLFEEASEEELKNAWAKQRLRFVVVIFITIWQCRKLDRAFLVASFRCRWMSITLHAGHGGMLHACYTSLLMIVRTSRGTNWDQFLKNPIWFSFLL